MFDRIPWELRALDQWVVWRSEDRGGPKPTKVPYAPHNGEKASVTDARTWSSFDFAVNAKNFGKYDGVGFVLSANDPYCFIDLDAPKGTSEEQQRAFDRQVKIFQAFDSYSERSPSGNGLHIIVRGHVPEGRRRGDVEVYSDNRYMTMTGEVHNDVPINDRQSLVDVLWNELSEDRRGNAPNETHDQPETATDQKVLDIAAGATNGQKFVDLYQGNWQQYYQSQSEADFALVDILAYYTQNREQITRMFMASALGQRDKARTNRKYLPGMISKSFDRLSPPVDISALKQEFDKVMAAQAYIAPVPQTLAAPVAAPELPVPARAGAGLYDVPPGLVGEIAQFVYQAAPRPVPEIALVAALGLMAGICGRSYNVSGTGLNQYILMLAPTGCGKEAAASGIEKLMAASTLTVPAGTEFVGPAEIASPQALIKYLSNTAKSFVSIVGEFGLRLQQMTATNANTNELGLRRILLDLYNKSGRNNVLRPTIYSDRANNTDIVEAPSFSMMAESTPERFYQSLSEDMVSEGFLPRFTIIEYHGDRPELNEAHASAVPSENLAHSVAELMAYSLATNQANNVVDVRSDDGATQAFNDFNRFCDAQINNSEREVIRHIWNRGHLKSMKLAALIAVGINPYKPCITIDVAVWAIRLVTADAKNMLTRFDSGDIGMDSGELKQVNAVVKAIVEYLEGDVQVALKYGGNAAMHHDKIVPYAYVQRKLGSIAAFRNDRIGATNSLKRTMQTLVDRGELAIVNKMTLHTNYGSSSIAYGITSPATFIRNAKKG